MKATKATTVIAPELWIVVQVMLLTSNKAKLSYCLMQCLMTVGIGRVTKHLLLKFFDCVDLLEQNQKFLTESKAYLGPQMINRVGNHYNCGLQEWTPDSGVKYDCIWTQWVTGHLTDEDFIVFLHKCKSALKPNGIIFIKDNTTSSDDCDADTNDSSVTRPLWLLLEIFKRADLTVICRRKQYKMPKGLYPVHMFALRSVSHPITGVHGFSLP